MRLLRYFLRLFQPAERLRAHLGDDLRVQYSAYTPPPPCPEIYGRERP